LVTQNKELTPRAIAAVEKLHQAGIAFAITSGRPPRGMAMLIGPLKISTTISAFNGGLFHPAGLFDHRFADDSGGYRAASGQNAASRQSRCLDLSRE